MAREAALSWVSPSLVPLTEDLSLSLSLSRGHLQDLIQCMLTPASYRYSIPDVFRHRWLLSFVTEMPSETLSGMDVLYVYQGHLKSRLHLMRRQRPNS
ncbi:hypothetical protein chiPu_0031787 [Chiloscyllium punctatum]|uniref:Uncharacterized protein n=1 Tax=Chiloscyllium punctatum TaxID=137246 RepID=A0A401TXE8_CHIPU|nr:hypothetical protein [Chiloscyllium punctatum]